MTSTPYRPSRKKWDQALSTNLARLVLIAACALTLIPLVWVFASSFSTAGSLYSASLIPEKVTLQNFENLFVKTDFLIWVQNSATICLGGSALAMVLTVSMAYSFSRFRFWGRRYGLLVLILIQMLPSTVTIVAIYWLLQKVGLIDHAIGLMLVYAGTTIPFNAWLMRGYFDSLPHELEEAAYVDGANRWQAFVRIAVPLCVPMAVVVFIFNLIAFYNDYLLASIVLSGKENYTVALGLRFFSAPYAANWAMFAAASLLASLPIAAIFYGLQRFLVQGLTRGALKG